ncbi:MAG: zf-HC2 domain-containing protein [Candidatus Eremiobacteraeota bacterium]|nr:zf-HC2 domain-containing protein [Candidatus Eremiobacteraeota bacterium]
MTQHLTTEQLVDYVHSALSPGEDASIHAHLDDCGHCRDDYAAEVSLTEALRKQAILEERELPGVVKAAIWSEIRNARPSPISRLAALWRPAIALPLAAVLALAVYFGPGVLHRQAQDSPSIEAAYYLQDHAALNNTVPFGDRTGANPAALENPSPVFAEQTAVIARPAISMADASH